MNFPDPSNRYSLPDETLVEMLAADSEWALKEIFNRYNLRLFRQAVGVLQDEDLAKDVVQNVFIDLWNRRRSSGIQTLSHYLSTAVRFQVLKQLRNGKAHAHHLKTLAELQLTNQTQETIDHNELENVLQTAVEQLAPRCKEVFVLSRFENLSHKEISSRLNISTKTVEVQITKALSLLRQKIQKLLFFSLLLTFL